MNTRLQDI